MASETCCGNKHPIRRWRMRYPSVSKMSSDDLLRELASFEAWSGDDFSLSEPGYGEYRRQANVRAEILRRMEP